MCTSSQTRIIIMSKPEVGTSGDTTPLSGMVPKAVLKFSQDYIQANHVVVLLILVILITYIVFTWWRRAAESFMPTALMRAQVTDDSAQASGHRDLIGRAIMNMGAGQGNGKGNGYESMEGDNKGKGHGVAAPAASVATIGALQGVPTVTSNTDPSSPLFPGSASWQVLQSPAFNCGGRDLQASSNAWGWMSKVAKGEAYTAHPTDDADFSKIAAGL